MSVSAELPRAVAEATVTCQSHPWQVEGRLWDGPMFYLRARSGRASLGLGASLVEAVEDGWANPTIDDAPWEPTNAEGWALFDRLLVLRGKHSAPSAPTASEDRDV